MSYGHAAEIVAGRLRVDGTSPLVRVDVDAIIRAAADLCDVPLEREHVCGGVWTFARGKTVPGRPGQVFGLARCSRCPAHRDATIGPDGIPHGGPIWVPVDA